MLPHFTLSGPEDAPVLVLGNALGTTTALWNDFTLPFRLLRFDHPGHGGSAPVEQATIESLASDVVELLDHLELRRVHYCGLSLGGMLGTWLAANTDRIDRLALICTSAWYEDKAAWDERMSVIRSSGVHTIADSIVSRWFTPTCEPAGM